MQIGFTKELLSHEAEALKAVFCTFGPKLGRRDAGVERGLILSEVIFAGEIDVWPFHYRFLMLYTFAGPLPVRFLTRLARAAFPKFVAASSSVIPSRCATRLINSSSFAVKEASSGLFSVTQKSR